ncbi:ABC transporter ATP-binding protein (plasmid) [Borrelia hermsii YBT]|uniref:ABC transporter ATP-binding protein n=1 Tax=Borrelia hermsii YBT TaxID=1313295 RepID=W5T1W7_BORHE|nr:ABC transporter ATP-binding protein [Borrelia hermsii]AHH13255.1 ABC transporter ATP-binding protein [Borrelia hermsii YBT]
MGDINLDLKLVNKRYKIGQDIVHANKDISLSLKSRDMVWISGPTGSGKTTLMNLISGIDSLDTGEICFNSTLLNSMNEKDRTLFRRYNIGLIFQHFELIPSLTGFDNISLPLRFSRKSTKQLKARTEELIEFFELSKFVNKRPRYMSGGQRQRIGIARAFVYNPRLVIGDEITSHLDKETAIFVYTSIQKYLRDKDAIGIFVSHDYNLKNLANKLYRIEDGILSLVGGEYV